MPLVLGTLVLLAGVVTASTRSVPRRGESVDQKVVQKRRQQVEEAPKTHLGKEWMVLGVWRNCKFTSSSERHRESAALPNGGVAESLMVRESAKDETAAPLPEGDPNCDNVEPSPQQIEANRAAIDAETARINGRPVGAPGGPRGWGTTRLRDGRREP